MTLTRSLHDHDPDALIATDASDRVVHWNAGAAANFGYSAH